MKLYRAPSLIILRNLCWAAAEIDDARLMNLETLIPMAQHYGGLTIPSTEEVRAVGRLSLEQILALPEWDDPR